MNNYIVYRNFEACISDRQIESIFVAKFDFWEISNMLEDVTSSDPRPTLLNTPILTIVYEMSLCCLTKMQFLNLHNSTVPDSRRGRAGQELGHFHFKGQTPKPAILRDDQKCCLVIGIFLPKHVRDMFLRHLGAIFICGEGAEYIAYTTCELKTGKILLYLV